MLRRAAVVAGHQPFCRHRSRRVSHGPEVDDRFDIRFSGAVIANFGSSRLPSRPQVFDDRHTAREPLRPAPIRQVPRNRRPRCEHLAVPVTGRRRPADVEPAHRENRRLHFAKPGARPPAGACRTASTTRSSPGSHSRGGHCAASWPGRCRATTHAATTAQHENERAQSLPPIIAFRCIETSAPARRASMRNPSSEVSIACVAGAISACSHARLNIAPVPAMSRRGCRRMIGRTSAGPALPKRSQERVLADLDVDRRACPFFVVHAETPPESPSSRVETRRLSSSGRSSRCDSPTSPLFDCQLGRDLEATPTSKPYEQHASTPSQLLHAANRTEPSGRCRATNPPYRITYTMPPATTDRTDQ